MTGAIPVFLTPTRNHFGIIGPIPLKEFKWKSIAQKIARHPLLKNGKIENGRAKPRVLTLTQSTYDGIIYNVETINEQLDGKIDTLHFDEAWLPHAAFHAFYRDMHAIGGLEIERRRNRDSMVFSTQSTHKMLAGLSQASQILIRNSQNESARSLHVQRSVSDAHVDVAAVRDHCVVRCRRGDDGAARAAPRWSKSRSPKRSISDARCAKSMTSTETHGGSRCGAPKKLPAEGIGTRDDWILKSGDDWHGFGDVAAGFNMLDPIKATVITPGLNLDGSFVDPGIPAAVVTRYLAEHGIIVEKTGLYSFFIMFTIGITKGRWNTMVTELQQFKDDYDKNQPLWRVMPEFLKGFPQYEKMGLRQLCDSVHEIYRQSDIARLTTEMYLSEMEPVMKPTDAYAQMAHSAIDRVPIDDLEGRVTAVLLTPYPPGIPLLIPGERINATIVRYLQFARDLNARYPGFGTDIHGLAKNEAGAYFLDCVSHNVQPPANGTGAIT